MQFLKYIPAKEAIGADLKQILSYSESWYIDKQTPYIGCNLYPPLASVLFTPLLAVAFSSAYKIITLINVLFYVLLTLVLPLRMGKEKNVSSLLMLVFITGFISYGFQFELERGQFNMIAVFICFLAIWIYHHHNKYRYVAYFLFTISVQLKVFPFIFIMMLISDWHDWKNNIKKFSILFTVNFALFFVLGSSVFFDFINAIMDQTANPYVWVGNHSIRAFAALVSDMATELGYGWVAAYSGLLQAALLAVVAACILLIVGKVYRQRQEGINSHLLLACSIGALLVPSVSHDYKLSILVAPIAIVLSEISLFTHRIMRPRPFFILLIIILSAGYFSTLFSFTHKPLILSNNCPALVAMLLAVTCLSVKSEKDPV